MVKPHFKLKSDGSYSQTNMPNNQFGELSPDFDIKAYNQGFAPVINTIFDGEKFPGGFGPTQLQCTDYWTLRERSGELFRTNIYARGLIRRLITNEINTGLTPEAAPDEMIIGVEEDSLNGWTEYVENRFAIWGKNKVLCDFKHASTFAALQKSARQEALIDGDVLVVLRQNQKTKLPTVELISGSRVQTPFDVSPRKGNVIRHGVELDSAGRVVAHWVTQKLGDPKRIPARGEKSGRLISWLLYGTDKRIDNIRGEPLLSIILQSLKEIDRYRDSAQRKAVVNSILAMFIKKGEDKMGSLPLQGGAQKKGGGPDCEDEHHQRNINRHVPGVVMEELQQGEEPVGFNSAGTDEKFGDFEAAIIHAIAWANEVPPEILTLAFSNNYSASAAAINEFKIYLNKIWAEFGEDFCQPIYSEWMISEVLNGKISAPGLLEAWRDTSKYDIAGAWLVTDWYGSIKPSTDTVKQVKGSGLLIDRGLSTHARESRTTTGTKFSKNVKRLKRENQMIADAQRPLAEFKQEFGEEPKKETGEVTAAIDHEEFTAMMDDYLEEVGALNA